MIFYHADYLNRNCYIPSNYEGGLVLPAQPAETSPRDAPNADLAGVEQAGPSVVGRTVTARSARLSGAETQTRPLGPTLPVRPGQKGTGSGRRSPGRDRPLTRDRGSRRSQLRFLAQDPWPLLGILALQAALSMRLVWSNTAFNDEALYLWSGHWVIAHLLYGTKVPRFQTYFSGAPVIYPVIGAIADSYGGLVLARLLSLAFMLGATVLCYLTGKRLFGWQAGLIGAGLFGLLGPVQFLGALATYDAMALFCLSLSAWLVVRAGAVRNAEPLLILAALALTAGDAAKYATVLWNPVVIALAGIVAPGGGWRPKLSRAARVAGFTAAFLLVLLRIAGSSYWRGLLFTTLARPASTVPMLAIFRDSTMWIGIVVLIAARSVVIASDSRARMLGAVLTAAALLAPLNQARIHTGTALQKHVAFGAWFAAIAAGWVLAYAIKRSKYSRWRIGYATLLVVGLIGAIEAPMLTDAWPDSAPVVAAVQRAMVGTRGPILSEQGVVLNYYLHLPPARVINTFAFTYSPPGSRDTLSGLAAYLAALRHDYFSVVEIDGAYARRSRLDHALTDQVESEAAYRLVFDRQWRDHSGKGFFMVWRYQPTPRSRVRARRDHKARRSAAGRVRPPRGGRRHAG